MKNTALLLGLIVVVLTAFDGRKRHRTTLKKSISAIKQKHLSTKAYQPKLYTKVENDTILNSGFAINVVYDTHMQNAEISKPVTTRANTLYYRNFKANVTVHFKNTTVYHNHINKPFFISKGLLSTTESKNFILKNVWIIDNPLNEFAEINFVYNHIHQKKGKTLTLKVNANGSISTYQNAIQTTT